MLESFATIQDKLAAFTTIPDDIRDCWIWAGLRQKTGHGKFYWKGFATSAHRAVYKAFVDSDIDGLDVDHLCKNPPCVNPDHLEAVTSRENTLRGTSPPAMNILKTECPKGHQYTPENTRINKAGNRSCRECSRVRWRAYYYQNREKLNKARDARR